MLFRAAMLSRQSFGTNHVAVHRPPLICSRPKICLRNRSHLAFSNFKIKDFGGMEPLTLESEAKTVLEDYLSDHTFCSQVYDNAKAKSLGTTVKYTGLLFEPVPWSPSTPHGMPQVLPCLRSCTSGAPQYTRKFLVNPDALHLF